MTLNLIETLKTSIYSPIHTQNTKLHVIFEIPNSKETCFQKTQLQNNQRFVLIFKALFLLLRATQPN